MIKTSRQLKDLVRNRSKGNNAMAQVIIRRYIMERFLERVSMSDYKGKLKILTTMICRRLFLQPVKIVGLYLLFRTKTMFCLRYVPTQA